MEKDFWVRWTLRRLFELQKENVPTLVFKRGTSLSKAFGAIRRFSEDIDLSFDRTDLGYTGERDPKREGISRKAANKLIEAIAADVEQHIAEIGAREFDHAGGRKLAGIGANSAISQKLQPTISSMSLGESGDREETLGCYQQVNPPSTGTTAPVIRLAASEARNRTALATSCAWPMRPIGVSRNHASMRGPFSGIARTIGVSI